MFYVTQQGDSIMGVDLFDKLGGSVQLGQTTYSVSTAPDQQLIANVATRSSLSTVRLESYPSLLKSTGQLRGFVHRPQVNLQIKPVQQRFWHPPQTSRDQIEKELLRMEEEGVIERVDTSEWISNLVTSGKRDGGLRLSLNLTDVNKAFNTREVSTADNARDDGKDSRNCGVFKTRF